MDCRARADIGRLVEDVVIMDARPRALAAGARVMVKLPKPSPSGSLFSSEGADRRLRDCDKRKGWQKGEKRWCAMRSSGRGRSSTNTKQMCGVLW